jgi:sulfur relay (sulfurtransferase) DsrC/TusE family protein
MLVFTTVELNIKETFSIRAFSFKFYTKKLAVRKFLTNPDNQVIVKTARTKVSKKIILIIRIRQIFSDGPAKITHNDSDKSRGSNR